MSHRPVDWSPLVGSDPVPGDPDRVEQLGRHYRRVASAISDAATKLRRIADHQDLQSEAVDAFRSTARDVGRGVPGWLYVLGVVSAVLGLGAFIDTSSWVDGRGSVRVADVSTAVVVDVRVVLPDHWWVVPLPPPGARTRSVERLVERQFAGIGDQPLLRADSRRQLLAQAETAAPDGAGLVQLAFATPMLPLRQPLLELFDAVAGALRWVTADVA